MAFKTNCKKKNNQLYLLWYQFIFRHKCSWKVWSSNPDPITIRTEAYESALYRTEGASYVLCVDMKSCRILYHCWTDNLCCSCAVTVFAEMRQKKREGRKWDQGLRDRRVKEGENVCRKMEQKRESERVRAALWVTCGQMVPTMHSRRGTCDSREPW